MSNESDIYIYNLIGKKLSGQITENENEILQNFITSSEEARRKFDELKKLWYSIHVSVDQKSMPSHQKISDKIWDHSFS